jgi:CMP-N,N'-diacetyllegionaminic acid synthase
MTAVAFIPARGGSERVPRKNIRLLNGHPLLAYSIAAAKESGAFDRILVSSDDTEILSVAASYGADCVRRPADMATGTSPDIEWVEHAIKATLKLGDFDVFSILRPTSPFRLASTIKRAFRDWYEAQSFEPFTSLRAVSPVSEHPGKTWRIVGGQLVPVLLQPLAQPFHDSQLASLPPVYVQNASLEIAWRSTVENTGTISGSRVMPFLSEGHEGFDINSERDWLVAEQMILDGVELPHVS